MKDLFIERTNPDGSYTIVWGPVTTDLDSACRALCAIESKQRLELWSRSWAESPQGFAPIAFRNKPEKLS